MMKHLLRIENLTSDFVHIELAHCHAIFTGEANDRIIIFNDP